MSTTTNTTKPTHRPIAALGLPRTISLVLVYAENIVTRMTGNPHFPTPTPNLASVTARIGDLRVAEAAALARTKGAATVRNQKRTALVSDLQALRGYVQTVADADPGNAAAIIESAGLAVRKTATHHARALAAKRGSVSGVATITAKVVSRRASYEWQYSTDGGKTWITAPATLQAKTTVSGLLAGSTVQFRSRTVTRAGEGDWSQPVSLMIQ
jgi:hypothetical protein